MENDVFSYINGMNATFLDEVYQNYLQDPLRVDASWRGFFEGISLSKELVNPENNDIKVIQLIEAYRKHGHRKVVCNPLQEKISIVPELSLSLHGFTPNDLTNEVSTFGFLKEKKAPLKDLIQVLEDRYCRGIGFDVERVSAEIDEWMRSHIEKSDFMFSKEDKLQVLQDILQAELFEGFLHTKYPGQTRFSLEGGETFIPLLRFLIEYASNEGVEEIVLGMAHRGRLNVLTSLLDKSYIEVFEEFEDEAYEEDLGDVKYHKGVFSNVLTRQGKEVAVSLVPNPSHLESINPIVEGQVRAKQDVKNDSEATRKILPLLVHGDASLSGQGIIYETLQLAKLEGYKTGGTLHIVLNNHIGYTTLPKEGRSTPYCTDIAKAFGFPVFHVSAERPFECIEAVLLAIKIRQTFHADVFIDFNCYRKYGHNEGDEPTFTQPLEYHKIKGKSSLRQLIEKQLILEKIITEDEISQKEEAFNKSLLKDLEAVTKRLKSVPQTKNGACKNSSVTFEKKDLSIECLHEIGKKICQIPEGFFLHSKLQKLLQNRLKMIEDPTMPLIDWGLAEHLAYGSLLAEKISIRLSGQDVGRGTFSHRHAVWIDQKTGGAYVPLQHVKKDQSHFNVYNSPLSEFGVMGFDIGYSLAHPRCLVLWEAQYGDFYNGAQIVIDQYLSTSEKKWGSRCNMVLLLPHGYEGKGPEHSSARVERFLQLCAEDNLIVANCTTPAQFFHLLRRQAYLENKRPLIVFTPKVLLRFSSCVSSLEELATGSFLECLDDPVPNKKAKKIFLCSGKVFYDLMQEREVRKAEDVAILRLEQLYPFPEKTLTSLLQNYPQVTEWIWVQEEPKNMGAWSYMQGCWLERYKEKNPLRYVGREESASPAAGSYATHKKQYEEFMKQAFTD